jgi:uncharacterized membrane protein
METKNIFSINTNWNYKNIVFFTFIILLPNLLSVFNIPTSYGFNIHFFQLAIILAAILYGPTGGMISGLVGSIYSAVMMNNPYLIVGNIILGLCVGLFVRYKWNTIAAVLTAFAIELPWLIGTDYYLMHMPIMIIMTLIGALFLSNLIWAVVAHYSSKPLKNLLK